MDINTIRNEIADLSDDAIIDAINNHFDDYTIEARHMLNQEAGKRGLMVTQKEIVDYYDEPKKEWSIYTLISLLFKIVGFAMSIYICLYGAINIFTPCTYMCSGSGKSHHHVPAYVDDNLIILGIFAGLLMGTWVVWPRSDKKK